MGRLVMAFRQTRAEAKLYLRELSRANLPRIALAIFTIMLISGMVLWLIEGRETFRTPFDAIWWAIVTMTTVGYGDITPQEPPGKLAAMVIILTGVAMVSVFTATISSVFVATRIREGEGLQDIFYEGHLVIAGWNPGAETLLESLREMSGGKINVVFVNNLEPSVMEDVLERYRDLKPKFVRGDSTHETPLRRAGVDRSQAVILLPDMQEAATAAQVDQKTILAALTVKELNPRVSVYAYALEAESVPHLRRGGVDRVVLRDAHAGYLLACHALAPGIPEVIDELLTITHGHRLERVRPPRNLIGKPVSEVREWAQKVKQGLLIGLVSEQKVLGASDILSEDFSSIDAFIKRKFEEAGRSADELAATHIEINPDSDRILNENDVAVIITRVDASEEG